LTKGRNIEFPEHAGTFSMKCVLKGKEQYTIGSRNDLIIDSSTFLILNSSTAYKSYLKPGMESETLSIFFRNDFANDIIECNTRKHDWLLDNYPDIPERSFKFFEQSYAYDNSIKVILRNIYSLFSVDEVNKLLLNELFQQLVLYLISTQKSIKMNIENIDLVKKTTRLEIYRRLKLAKEFIDENFTDNIDIYTISQNANLSSFHFLRLFNQAFNITPHRYQVSRRLELAKQLLSGSELPVTQICFECGFESVSHFSRLFKSRFGVPPLKFRKFL